jgi:hypothetical protein
MNVYRVEGLSCEEVTELIMSCLGLNITILVVPQGLEFVIEADKLTTLEELCGKVGAVPSFDRSV